MENFGTNSYTYYVILPILAIAAGLLTWAIVRARVSKMKRVGLIAGGLLALFGFVVVVGIVYYQCNATFAASFRLYAYSALAPTKDPSTDPAQKPVNPFAESDGYMGMMLAAHQVYKEDGQLRMPRIPFDGLGDYGMYVFTPGQWMIVEQTDDVLTVRQPSENFPGPTVINTSLWWALTTDLYRAEYTVE